MSPVQKLKFPEVQSHRVAGDEGPANLHNYDVTAWPHGSGIEHFLSTHKDLNTEQ